jgi:hypothetical protein
MRMVSRWASTTPVSTTASSRQTPIPSWPTPSPLKTEVIANATPFAVPTIPLARSWRSSGTSSVTVVESATARRFPTTAPTRMRPTSTQKAGFPSSRKEGSGVIAKNAAASAKATSVAPLETSIDVRRKCRSTNVPKNIPEMATNSM